MRKRNNEHGLRKNEIHSETEIVNWTATYVTACPAREGKNWLDKNKRSSKTGKFTCARRDSKKKTLYNFFEPIFIIS